jgi:subtilisin family serine protease
MKKYFIHSTNQKKRPFYPFWKPWGCLGCLGRALSFLLCLALLLLLYILLTTYPRHQQVSTSTPIDTIKYTIPDSVPNNTIRQPQPVADPPTNYTPDPKDIIYDPIRHKKIDDKHILVIIDPDSSQASPALQTFCQEFGNLYTDCSVEAVNEMSQMVLLAVPASKREQILSELHTKITDIAFYADVIEIFIAKYIPSDPLFNIEECSWHLKTVLAPEAWDITMGDKSVKVAVVDSYFDLSHPEFTGMNIESPISIERGTTDVSPNGCTDKRSFSHGTHVLGLIGAQENGIGTIGVAPRCTFIPISLGQSMNTFTMIEGVLYALHKGANVINVSIGLEWPDDIAANWSLEEQLSTWINENKRVESSWDYVFNMLDKRFCTIVWSAGNNNIFELIDYSKRNSTTIKVDAVDQKLNKAWFSNFGNVDFFYEGKLYKVRESVISAPGDPIVSTVPNRMLQAQGGTSMAAPIVTGAVALMKSIDPTISNEDIISILRETAKPLSNDSIGPLLQIRPALDAVKANMTDWEDFKRSPTGNTSIWKKTDQSRYVDEKTEEFRYYAQDYLIFNSKVEGTMEVHQIGANNVFSANFNVEWGKDECFINIIGQISSPNVSTKITTKKIRLFKDENSKVGYEIILPKKDWKSNIRRLKVDDR